VIGVGHIVSSWT
jgi:hypothetical protein